MKRKIRQKLAVVLSLLVMLGTILGGQVPLVVQAAEGEATIAVSFRDNSASLGKVEIYTGGNWVDYMQAEGDGVIAASNVRIVPNEGYEIDWGGITWREGTETPASVPEEVKTALVGEDGCSLKSGNAYELASVEFQSSENAAGGGEGDASTFWADA